MLKEDEIEFFRKGNPSQNLKGVVKRGKSKKGDPPHPFRSYFPRYLYIFALWLVACAVISIGSSDTTFHVPVPTYYITSKIVEKDTHKSHRPVSHS